MNAARFILERNQDSENTAVIHGDKTYKFSQVADATISVANFLNEKGRQENARAIILDDSSFFWIASYLGVMLSGRIAVPVPTNIEPEKLERIMESAEPEWFLIGSKYLEKYKTVISDVSVLTDSTGERKDFKSFSELDQDEIPSWDDIGQLSGGNDLAALMYTSGSTGEPRGVMVTHDNIIANTSSIIESLFLDGKDRIMALLPFYYCFGTSLLHTHLRVGGSVVIENSFLYPEKILNSMENNRCTGLAGVPSTFQILLRKSTLKKRNFDNLRYIQQAGGKLPVSFMNELREALPDKQIFIMYGQTEATARLSCLSPERLDDKLGSIGKGIPGVRLEVLDHDGHEVKPGEIGEIVASGGNITAGYWNAPEETAKFFKNGKLYTGDLATVDEDGYIYVVDREKDFIKCAGHRVSCKELEEIVLRHSGVIEAAIIGMEDDNLGEAICLFASHVDGQKAMNDLDEHCMKNIKWPFTPKKIIVLKNLPKNSSGKPDKLKMKDILAESNKGEGEKS
jgi:acyl-CoA synthetase (AMP-forming)/AMP-acid ligase II